MPISVVVPTRETFQQTSVRFNSPVSDEELMRFSRENPGMVVERMGWDEIVMSPSGMESDHRSGLIYAQLLAWSNDAGGEAFGSSAGFEQPDGTVMSPDAAWLSDERLQTLEPADRRGFGQVCPELIVEVASPSDSLPALREKCHRWRAAGARVALLVDADHRRTEVFSETEGDFVSDSSQLPVPGFPGLTLNLERVWKGLSTKRT